MTCKKCSAQVAEGSIVCPYCLKRLKWNAKRRLAVIASVIAGVLLLAAAAVLILT